MARRKTKTEQLTKAAFREVEEDEPSIVAETRRKKGKVAAEAQKKAIALSKARRAGARIPKKKRKRGNPGHGRQMTNKTLF